MRYKQGQELFIHLFNRFRNKKQFKITNIKALFQLGDLLNIILDENYEQADTSIPVSCQVLAATFYLEVDDQKIKKRFLFELIQDNNIWKNMSFWERSISQHIQCDIIEQIESESMSISEKSMLEQKHNYIFHGEQLDRVIDVVYNKLTHI
jgi:hypothetical protein